MRNRQVLLAAQPTGTPQPEHFRIATVPVPELRDREILVRNDFLSIDPAMRGWVTVGGNASTSVKVGEVMRSFAAGEIVASRHPGYAVGDKVSGVLGWQEYAVSDGTQIERKIKQLDLPISYALGILGMTGATAYFGLFEAGQPRLGDTVVVSSAAGSVGSVVGQLAKLAGCRVVGIAGGPAKVRMCVEEYGFDAAIDYRGAEPLGAALAKACPNGIDVYFDNTTGAITDAVMPLLSVRARVVICGTVAVEKWDPPPLAPCFARSIMLKRVRVQGFVVFDYQPRYDEAFARLADWLRDGSLKYREDTLDGLEACPGALASLFRGDNMGKSLVRVNH